MENLRKRRGKNNLVNPLLILILLISGLLLVACGDSASTIGGATSTNAVGATNAAAITASGEKTKIKFANVGATAESAPLYLGYR